MQKHFGQRQKVAPTGKSKTLGGKRVRGRVSSVKDDHFSKGKRENRKGKKLSQKRIIGGQRQHQQEKENEVQNKKRES